MSSSNTQPNTENTDEMIEIFSEFPNEQAFSDNAIEAMPAQDEDITDPNEFPEAAADDEMADLESFIDDENPTFTTAFPMVPNATQVGLRLGQRTTMGMHDVVLGLFDSLRDTAATSAPAAPPLRRTSSAGVLSEALEEDDDAAVHTHLARRRSADQSQVNNSPAPVDAPEAFDSQSVLVSNMRAVGDLADGSDIDDGEMRHEDSDEDDEEDEDQEDEDESEMDEENAAIEALPINIPPYEDFIENHWQAHVDRRDRLAFLEGIPATGRVYTDLELHERAQLRAADLRFFFQASYILFERSTVIDGQPVDQHADPRAVVTAIVTNHLWGSRGMPEAVFRTLAERALPDGDLIDVPTPGDMRLVETVPEYVAGGECMICLEVIRPVSELTEDEKKDGEIPARLMTCGHHFHHGCVKSWLVDKKTCPLCRKRVESED